MRLRGRLWWFLVLALLATAVAAYAVRSPLLASVGGYLVRSDPLARADAIVVLGGSSGEREIEAADLYRAGWAPRVLLTLEREPEPVADAELRKRGVRVESLIDRRARYLAELGVPPSAVVVLRSRTVQSTIDEAFVVRDWVRGSSAGSLIVVTSPFHTRRARLAFDHALRGTRVALRVRSTSLGQFRPGNWWHNRDTLRDGLFEWQKLVFYRLSYW